MMQWLVVCWTLAVVIMVQSSSALPSTYGRDTATLYAVDTATNQETRQTKRDIEAFGSDTSSDKRSFTLQLTSGQRLRMSLERRAIDTSGAKFKELTEEGEREIIVEERDCFFSGVAEGEEGEGVASVSMCGGELMGSISTGRRDYEILSLRQSGQRRDADDVMDDVKVTWTDRQTRGNEDDDLEHDVWIIPGEEGSQLTDKHNLRDGRGNDGDDLEDDVWIIPGEEGSQLTKKRNLKDGRVTIEIADFVDRWFIEDVGNKMGLVSNKQIINLILNKWSSVAYMLSDKNKLGWDFTLRIVTVVIMRTNPDYYPAKPSEKIGERMTHLCKGLKNKAEVFDQVTLHTGQTTDVNRMGLAWLGGMCQRRWQCSASRNSGTNFRTELHELGHSLGLNHDGRMDECVNDNQDPGFMGGKRDNIRPCYKEVLQRTLTEDKRSCGFSNSFPNYVEQFD